MQFEDICRETYPKIYNYILARTRNKEAAEDITQEVFFIAYKKGDVFLSHENPVAFLYVSAKNLLFDYFRETTKSTPLEEQEIVDARGDIYEQIRMEHADSIDESIYLKQVLGRLNDKERKLYELYYVFKKPMKVIARELRLNEAALRMKYVRLRKKVRRIVHDLDLDAF
ncbi:MAG: sigma-70 family RNA polymerase sigma factor [Lachnospiraceae bacterium]|nr:sigma-70 family RNA polymerase sigma factor [Lachnospiraceae bacterium]